MSNITVQQLLEQHEKVRRAKDDVQTNDILHPEGGGIGRDLRGTFYESSLKIYLTEAKKMRQLMNEAAPDVLAEAQRIAREKELK